MTQAKLRLIDARVSPVGGWRWLHSRAKRVFQATSRDELLQKIENYERANGMAPTPNLAGEIESWICYQPGNERRCLGVMHRGRKALEYAAGTVAYLTAKMMGDRAFIDEATATRRAKVCANCPHNLLNENDSKLQYYTDEAMKEQIGDRKTEHDDKLFTCAICSCLLRAKVHFSREIVNRSLPHRVRLALPRGRFRGKDGRLLTCWQLVEPRE